LLPRHRGDGDGSGEVVEKKYKERIERWMEIWNVERIYELGSVSVGFSKDMWRRLITVEPIWFWR